MADRRNLAALLAKPHLDVPARSRRSTRRRTGLESLWTPVDSLAVADTPAHSLRRFRARLHAAAEGDIFGRAHRTAARSRRAGAARRPRSRDGGGVRTSPQDAATKPKNSRSRC